MEGTMSYEKELVLGSLKDQLADHKDILEEAWEGFAAEAQKTLTNVLASIEKGTRAAVKVYILAPSDHTREIELAIAMLDASTDTHVDLDSQDFANYVLGHWDWADRFLVSNAKYSTMAAGAMATRGLLPD